MVRAVGSVHIKNRCVVPMALLLRAMFYLNGLKSVPTKWIELMALKEYPYYSHPKVIWPFSFERYYQP
jgi:hypothetical protein